MSAVLPGAPGTATPLVMPGAELLDRFWHVDDDNQATREGWNVFLGGTGPEILRLEFGRHVVFTDHAQAHHHVYQQAMAGSPMHQRALMLTLLAAPGAGVATEGLLRERVPIVAPKAMPRVVIEVEGTVQRVSAPHALPLTLVEFGRAPVEDEPEFRPEIDGRRAYVSDAMAEVAPARLDMVRACQGDADYENAPPGACY